MLFLTTGAFGQFGTGVFRGTLKEYSHDGAVVKGVCLHTDKGQIYVHPRLQDLAVRGYIEHQIHMSLTPQKKIRIHVLTDSDTQRNVLLMDPADMTTVAVEHIIQLIRWTEQKKGCQWVDCARSNAQPLRLNEAVLVLCRGTQLVVCSECHKHNYPCFTSQHQDDYANALILHGATICMRSQVSVYTLETQMGTLSLAAPG